MLIPDTLFFYIMQNRGICSFAPVNLHSIRMKRFWKSKTSEEKAEFSAMRSKVQKKTYKKLPAYKKKKISKRFSVGMQKYWDNVSDDQKADHVSKMSSGMKKAWDESDDEFGPKIANRKNIAMLNDDVDVIHDVPRINDYAGVITASDMASLC